MCDVWVRRVCCVGEADVCDVWVRRVCCVGEMGDVTYTILYQAAIL